MHVSVPVPVTLLEQRSHARSAVCLCVREGGGTRVEEKKRRKRGEQRHQDARVTSSLPLASALKLESMPPFVAAAAAACDALLSPSPVVLDAYCIPGVYWEKIRLAPLSLS